MLKIIPKLFIIIFSSFLFSELRVPIDGAVLNSIYLVFEWNQEPDCTEYQIQVSYDDMFSDLIVDQYTSSTYYIDQTNFYWLNTYYWHVKCIDNSIQSWNQIYQFQIHFQYEL